MRALAAQLREYGGEFRHSCFLRVRTRRPSLGHPRGKSIWTKGSLEGGHCDGKRHLVACDRTGVLRGVLNLSRVSSNQLRVGTGESERPDGDPLIDFSVEAVTASGSEDVKVAVLSAIVRLA